MLNNKFLKIGFLFVLFSVFIGQNIEEELKKINGKLDDIVKRLTTL